MIQQFSVINLLASVIKRVEKGTGKRCFDYVPVDQPSPFYFVEFLSSQPGDTKTMYITDYTVYIHAIAEPGNGNRGVLELLERLEEALTEDIEIYAPNRFQLVYQMNKGVIGVQTDETGEKHAISKWIFRIAYGWKAKV